jgi:hypothetical protein
MRRNVGLAFAGVAAVCAIVLAVHNVPLTPTPADAAALRKLIPEAHARPSDFQQQIALILNVQDRVLSAAPEQDGIPLDQPRELGDLLRARHGACFDRSRAIETALRAYGFETRHAAIYSTAETKSALRSLATRDNLSHAITEVRTERGWMIVHSNTRWAGLTADGKPADLAAVRAAPRQKWSPLVRSPLPDIYRRPFTWVYGLYSRHGRFYAPYDPIPDVNWGELAQNL